MNEYYTPSLEEFVEGFKYQVSHTIRMDIWNMSTNEVIKGEFTTVWFDRVVPNLEPITYPHTFKDTEGTSYTYLNADPSEESFKSKIKRMLKENQIRCQKNIITLHKL